MVDAQPYAGVVDRAPSRELPDYAMPSSQDPGNDNGDDGDIAGGVDSGRRKKKRASRAFSTFEQEFKRVLVKWGNHPSILQQFCKMFADRDAELGDVKGYTWGHGSSKPTPQASRSHKQRKKRILFEKVNLKLKFKNIF